ncbi:MAG: FkbM family methyltransferase [Terriglobales bacterium]
MATARELAARGWRPLRRGLHRTQDRLNGGRGIPLRAAPGWTVRTPPEAWEELRYWLCYEAATFALIRRIWRRGMTVLDVGAHHGLFSLCCCRAEAMPGRVVTVEPSPRALPLLRRARALYPGLNWTVVEAAAGERVGRLRMAAGMEQMLVVDAALHAEGRAAPGAVPVPAVEVQVARLDQMARELMLWPDLVKVDVEGYEVEALRGASGLLAPQTGARQPWIVLEWHCQMLRQRGLDPLAALVPLAAGGYTFEPYEQPEVRPLEFAAVAGLARHSVCRLFCRPRLD